MQYKFKFHRNQRIWVYAQIGDNLIDENNNLSNNNWEFLPALITRRMLKEPHPEIMAGGKLIDEPRFETQVEEMYDILIFDDRLPKKCQCADFYVDRLYALDEPLIPRENCIDETL